MAEPIGRVGVTYAVFLPQQWPDVLPWNGNWTQLQYSVLKEVLPKKAWWVVNGRFYILISTHSVLQFLEAGHTAVKTMNRLGYFLKKK